MIKSTSSVATAEAAPPGGKYVDDEDALARLDGILVNFEAVGAVLEGVFDEFGGGGNESFAGDAGAEVAAGFDAGDDVAIRADL